MAVTGLLVAVTGTVEDVTLRITTDAHPER